MMDEKNNTMAITSRNLIAGAAFGVALTKAVATPNGTDDPGCAITSLITRGFTGHDHMPDVCLINANAPGVPSA